MEYRFLGRSGLSVSELCLGAMTFANGTDEPTAHRMLDRFVAAGGTFIDTADVYPNGTGASEEVIGRWLANWSGSRDDLVIASKVFAPMGPGPNQQGAGRKHIRAAVEASLRRLATDYLDLYQIHVWDDATPLEETLSTLDNLVREGKVRFVGASNYAGWQLQKAVDLARLHGWEPFVSLQPLYNVLDRAVERELVPVCRNEGLGVLPWSPLRGGWFTGKYRRGVTAPLAGTRWAANAAESWFDWDSIADERAWTVTDAVLAVAQEVGHSPAQVALRWLLQQPAVTAPIIGARTLEQLDDNLGATGWQLDDKQLDQLATAGAPDLPYPHDIQARFRRRS